MLAVGVLDSQSLGRELAILVCWARQRSARNSQRAQGLSIYMLRTLFLYQLGLPMGATNWYSNQVWNSFTFPAGLWKVGRFLFVLFCYARQRANKTPIKYAIMNVRKSWLIAHLIGLMIGYLNKHPEVLFIYHKAPHMPFRRPGAPKYQIFGGKKLF